MGTLDDTIVNLLEKLSQIVRFMMWEVAKEERLSPIQMQILIHVCNNAPSFNKASIIAREFDLTKATMSDTIALLEKKKMLKKVKDINDKRSSFLSLTRKGEQTVDRISCWSDTLKMVIGKFSEEEKREAMLFLIETVKSLFDRGVISAAHMCVTCSNFTRNYFTNKNKPHRCCLTGKSVSNDEIKLACSNYINETLPE